MARIAWFESPLLVGFEELRLAAERASAINDGFPPYNVEAVGEGHIRIAIAVAGFAMEDLQVMEEASHLIVEGDKQGDTRAQYVHRGIAARRFRRVFVLADGFKITKATLEHGLLSIDAVRPPAGERRQIPITTQG